MKAITRIVVCLLVSGCGRPAARVSTVQVLEMSVAYPAGTEMARGILYQPGRTPAPALIFVPDDRGLTDWAKDQGKRLADQGYAVLAVDLYRSQPVKELPHDRIRGDLKATVDYLAGRKEIKADAIGILGFESGAGFALEAACRDPRLKTAVVSGGPLPADAAALANLQGPVLGVFAGRDENVSTIEQFQKAMQQAGKRVVVEVYPDCEAGFMNPASAAGGSKEGRAAAQTAWGRIEKHLADRLKR